MSDSKPHPHAELMRQWAEDNQTIPPAHEWECRSKNGKWERLDGALRWFQEIQYRRVAKSIPHPNAERLMQWAADNQTIPPTHKWEFMVIEYPAEGWFPVTSMTSRKNDDWLYRRTPV